MVDSEPLKSVLLLRFRLLRADGVSLTSRSYQLAVPVSTSTTASILERLSS